MTDIQRARDVLAKWRKESSPGNWVAGGEGYRDLIWNPQHPNLHPALAAVEEGDMHLIVGTAGNPDLLDAIDNMLRWVTAFNTKYDVSREFGHYTASIAAAILAADERMSA
ncbi:hypothetical protein KK103_11780 [Curtobacterium flaccumfaciens pv. flaccumfaciens]|uniref:Uncharacterized protein n=1 Tax=Curtobacterium flaccumfaciens pv. flaccumfaciens TaxID=138532 RepID=A0A9Q2W6Z3_9MICO|nr:hypothetical protein [Curtobacterium flaccumfaciens]MBT1542444.1 hypothetical protein [Curtobacterium flaccumfaciens pv. flaccumfaciens]